METANHTYDPQPRWDADSLTDSEAIEVVAEWLDAMAIGSLPDITGMEAHEFAERLRAVVLAATPTE